MMTVTLLARKLGDVILLAPSQILRMGISQQPKQRRIFIPCCFFLDGLFVVLD